LLGEWDELEEVLTDFVRGTVDAGYGVTEGVFCPGFRDEDLLDFLGGFELGVNEAAASDLLAGMFSDGVVHGQEREKFGCGKDAHAKRLQFQLEQTSCGVIFFAVVLS
jgi:hypothetical protein